MSSADSATVEIDPLVSVAFPVYNGETTLREALESVLSQDYRNLEVVILDNASTDGTPALVRGFADRDSRIRYHRNPSLLPMYENWQRAFELCSGEFFLWTAADDLRPPGTIRSLVEALRACPGAAMAHGPILVEREGIGDVVEVANRIPSSGLGLAGRVRAYVRELRHPAMMHGLFRADVVRQSTLRTRPKQTRKGGHYGQDYLFNLRVLTAGPAAYTPDPMLRYRDRIWRTSRLDDPIGADAPLTLRNLFCAPRISRVKHWTMFLVGSRYLLTSRANALPQRVWAALVFGGTFWRCHGSSLLREVLFQAGHGIAALAARILPSRLGGRIEKAINP